jgi:hypothetical protein
MSDGSFEFNCESLIAETAAFTASQLNSIRMLSFMAVNEADE